MGEYPTGPPAVASHAITSMHDAGPLVVFAFWALVVASLTAFWLMKRGMLRKSPAKPIYMHQHASEAEDAKTPAFVADDDLKPHGEARVEIGSDKTVQFQVKVHEMRHQWITALTFYFNAVKRMTIESVASLRLERISSCLYTQSSFSTFLSVSQ